MALTCSLEILDEVNVRFRGLDPETRARMIDQVTYKVPKARFMKRAKLTGWNGNIVLGNRNNSTTYLNILDRVLPIVQRRGYQVSVVDKRRPFSYVVPLIDEDYLHGVKVGEFEGKFEPHQTEAINSLLVNNGGIIEVATGGGKTMITAALVKAYQGAGKIVIIVPRIDLAISTQYAINQCASHGLSCGIWFNEIKDARHVTVSTWQSLVLSPELLEGVTCIIVDEAHDVSTKDKALGSLFDLLIGPARNVPLRIGMTGTIPEDDLSRQKMRAALGEVVFTITAYELQQKGFLAGCHVTMMKLLDSRNPSYETVRKTHELWSDELAWKGTDPARVQYIGMMLKMLAQEGNTLMLIEQKELGYALERMIPGAIFLSGDDSGKKRDQTYREINALNNAALICTYGIASTGINIPRLFNLILFEPGRGLVRVVQSIGRGLRRAEDKDYIDVYDLCSDAKFSNGQIQDRKCIYRNRRYPFTMIEVDYYADSHY